MLSIKEVLERVSASLVNDIPVYLTDGTVTRQVTAIHGSTENGYRFLTVVANNTAYNLPIQGSFMLDEMTLRKDSTALWIGPASYLAQWPCDKACVAKFNKCCSVANCKGCVDDFGYRKCKTADDAAELYAKIAKNW